MNHITQEQAIEKEKNRKIREALDSMKVAQQTPPKRLRMNEYITKDKALDIAENVGPSSTNAEYYHAICNEAIEWYIAQQAAPNKELTEEQLLWVARSHGINVPEGSLLGFYRDLMGTINIGNVDSVYTSQERVQKTAKSEQMPLTDEQIEDIAIGIAADDYDHDLVRRVECYHGIKEPKV